MKQIEKWPNLNQRINIASLAFFLLCLFWCGCAGIVLSIIMGVSYVRGF